MVVDAYEFNDPPPEGMEYLVVQIFARSTYEDSEPHEITFFDFNVTGARLIKYGTAFVVDPEPPLDAELLTGEETEGWVTFLVGSDEENLILIFDEWDNFEESSERFIALDEGASVTTPSGLDRIPPNTIGVDRQNPAAVGDKAVTDRWEITVVEVVRGEEALRLILDADDFNEPPEEGFEYLLAKIRAKNINVDGEEEWLDSTNFTVIGDLNEEYDTPFFTAPAPEFDANSYPGAEFEGWISLQAAEDDSGLLLIFESFYDFSEDSERYFALE